MIRHRIVIMATLSALSAGAIAAEPDEIRSIRARYDSFKQKLAGLSGSPVFSQKSSFTA